MKTALIDPNTIVYTGEWVADPANPGKYKWKSIPIADSRRVCEVVLIGNEFPVALPLYWESCADNVVADQWYFDSTISQFVELSLPPHP